MYTFSVYWHNGHIYVVFLGWKTQKVQSGSHKQAHLIPTGIKVSKHWPDWSKIDKNVHHEFTDNNRELIGHFTQALGFSTRKGWKLSIWHNVEAEETPLEFCRTSQGPQAWPWLQEQEEEQHAAESIRKCVPQEKLQLPHVASLVAGTDDECPATGVHAPVQWRDIQLGGRR